MFSPSGITKRVKRALALAFFTASLAACPTSRTEGLDPSKVPENLRADYDRFAHKCSKCHGLSRPLQAGITDDAQWVMYVNRMRRQPGSGISMEDQEVILRFLKWHAADLRKKNAEKNGTPAPAAAPPPTPAAPVHSASVQPAPTSPAAHDGGAQ